MCGNQLVFSGESFNFFTKLLADPFPQYSSILNKEGFVGAIVERTNLIKTLRRSTCLLSGQFIATKFGFDDKNLGVSLLIKKLGHYKKNCHWMNLLINKFQLVFMHLIFLQGCKLFLMKN